MGSTEIAKIAGEVALNAGLRSGFSALAAIGLMSPGGLIAAACFGAISYAVELPISHLCKTIHMDHHPVSRVIGVAITIFGSYLCAWQALRMAGYALSFKNATWLLAVGLGFETLFKKTMKQAGLRGYLPV